MYQIHKKKAFPGSFDRLDMLWKSQPQHHKMTTFSTLQDILTEHKSYRDGFDELREEYESNHYERFLIQLSWEDLPYRHETKKMIEASGEIKENPYVETFMEQFMDLDTETTACFLFPESYASQYFVIAEVCKKAQRFVPVKNLFPDNTKPHYLAVFDKEQMEEILLMYHLLYTNTSQEVFGGYSLYDYSLPWYQTHLWKDGVVMRSPYLPDPTAKYLGALPYYHNPSKTVYVRRNIEHILEQGYISSELEFFYHLTTRIMPFFQWWYEDLRLYEEQDQIRTDWRLKRTEIRTRLTAEGIIKPKWKNELSLFHIVRQEYPDTLYQYRPDWLGRQSLDLYIPSLNTAIEYQGIQHYHPVEFFGGQEALNQRRDLDRQKMTLCKAHDVRLILWPYDKEPTKKNLRGMIGRTPFVTK